MAERANRQTLLNVADWNDQEADRAARDKDYKRSERLEKQAEALRKEVFGD